MSNLTAGFIGFGLIGGSIAKGLKRDNPRTKIMAYMRTVSKLEQAKRDGVVDLVLDGIDGRLSECDIIFLCTPVEFNADYLKKIRPLLKDGAFITDVGSTKLSIHEQVKELQMEDVFVGGHPMAGSEKTGYENATDHLLENAYYIITPTARSRKEEVERLTAVAGAIRRSRTGLGEPGRPIGAMLFLGPTGVGKTALAKALAESWFGSEKALLKFDMSEYQEQHTVARLLGAPPGYLGHDEGGQLTEAVRRRPYSVVLFDEIEKAHPDIQNVLLQMLEDGQLTDSMGRKADFRNTIVLLTSNLGARFLAGQSAPLGFGAGSEAAFEKQSEAAVAEAKKWFRPELVGRLDELIVFRPLEEQSLCSIAEKLLGQLEERAARSGYQLTHTARVGPALAAKAHSPYGARELRRQVDRAVEQAFADQIASGSVSLGQHWTADCTEDGTIVVQETQTAGVG